MLFGLLRSRHLAASTEGQSPWTDRAAGVGKVWTDAIDGRAFPDDGWPQVGVCAIHPAGKGPTTITGANELGAAATSAAQDHGERRDGKWLQTFAEPKLICRHLRIQTPSSCESRVKI